MAYSNRSLTRLDAPVYVPGYGQVPNGRVPSEVAAEQASRDQNNAWWAERNARNDRYRKIATVGALAAGGAAALPALFAGGGAAAPSFGIGAANTGTWTTALPATVAGSTLPAAGAAAKFSIGRLLSNPLTSLAVNSATSLLGARAQNKANQYAVDRQAEGLAQQLAIEEKRIADEAAERAAQRIEDQRRWEAQEAHNAKVLAASEDERLFARRMLEEREGRRAAYESQYRQPALRSVRSILGF